MSRIKINLPQERLFNTTISVRVTDINYGGHLANQAVLGFCHEARVRFFKEHDQSELNFLGSGIIMTDAAIEYNGEAFLGDELSINLYADEINNFGFDFFYHIACGDKEIAKAKTGIVFFDYEVRKISKCPDGLNAFLDSCK